MVNDKKKKIVQKTVFFYRILVFKGFVVVVFVLT